MARLDAHRGPEVLQEDDSPKIKSIFDDIKVSLRVPLVNLIFRSLVRHPDYLELAWRQLQPNVRTVYFERRADALRTLAVDGMAKLGAPPRPNEEAAEVLRVFHYVNPKLLLAVGAMRAATTGSRPVLQTLPMEQRRQIVQGVPPDAPTVELVDPDRTDEQTSFIFEDIKSTLGVTVINTDYRALALWPDYLGWAWQSLKPVAGRPEYRQLGLRLRRATEEALLSLPFRMDLTPHTLRLIGLSELEIDEVRETLDNFYNLLPGLVANIAFLSIGADGHFGASRSPFPPPEK